jgi:iron complex outermembrane receptor protein
MSIIKKSLTIAGLLFAVNNLSAVELEAISVTSSTIDIRENSDTEASTVNFVSEEKIQEISPKQINEVLQTIPGITSDVRAGEVVEIHIRGVNQQEFMWEDTGVAVIIDGVPLWQNGGKFRINMKDIKNIKVIKGAASYLYGNNALAGAVIITTKKPKVEDSYSLEAQLGSFNYQDYTASIQKNLGDFSLNLNANYRATDGYWVDSELWNKSINGKLSYYINDTTDIALGIDRTRKYEQANRAGNTGVTQAKLTPEGSGRNSFQKDNYVDLDKYYINFNKQFENNYNLLINTYYYNDLYDYISSPQDTTGDGENDTYAKHTDEDIVQKGLKLEFTKDSENFGYLFGYEFGNKNFEDKSETLIDYSSTSRGVTTDYYKGERNDIEDNQDKNALYTEFKYQLTPKLVTTLNARFDNLEDSYDITNLDYDGTDWSTTKVNRDKDYNEMSYRISV